VTLLNATLKLIKNKRHKICLTYSNLKKSIMSKSKIILALLAGVAIGAVVAYTVQTINEQTEDENIADENKEPTTLENIAQQFSDKISSELKTAEKKIRTAVKKEIDALNPESELGLFL
jgi:uncharacterized protein HemX